MMRKYKISLSVEKRIILHLANFISEQNKTKVANDITQLGIANKIGIRLEHVSRSITKLVKEGLVSVKTTSIKDWNRRKKAYFITKKGIENAKKIEERFKNRMILIRNFDDEIREIKIKHLVELLGYKLNLLDAYEIASNSKDGIIDFVKLKK